MLSAPEPAFDEPEAMDDHACAWELHLAAAAGDARQALSLLGQAPEAAAVTDTRLRSPLHRAAAANHEAVAALLAAAAPEALLLEDMWGHTPLGCAAAAGAEQVASLLIQAAPSAADWDEYGPLDMAAREGHEGTARVLLAAVPAETAASPSFRSRLLSAAAEGGIAPLVAELLAQDSHLLQPEEVLYSLCFAASAGHTEVVKVILQHMPAAALASDDEDMTPLAHAAAAGQEAVGLLLLEAAPLAATLPDLDGNWPLHLACSGHCCEGKEGASAQADSLVRLLLAAAPEAASATNFSGETPMHRAAHSGRQQALELLLQAGPATALAPDSQARLPLHHAAVRGKVRATRRLLEVAPDAALAADAQGDLPCHLAATSGCAATVAALVAATGGHAAAGVRNATGWLPVDLLLARVAGEEGVGSGLKLRDGAGWRPQKVLTRWYPRLGPCDCLQAALPLLEVGPPEVLLTALWEAGEPALPLYAALVSRWAMGQQEWELVPAECPGLGPLLPAVLARGSVGEAGCLVRCLPGDSRQRLRTAALCLARAQHECGLCLPADIVWHVLAMFDA